MKRLYIKWMLAVVAASLLVTGCRKIEDLQKNPNVSDQASPKLLLTGIEYDMYDNAWSDYSYAHRMAQVFVLNFDYYGNQSYAWGAADYNLYTTLRNVGRLEIEAGKQGANLVTANYRAIAKFMRAWAYSRMTSRMGDIPLSDAMNASEGVYYPKYDKQKDVFKQCLVWLDDANTLLDSIAKVNPATAVDGDIFYGGDLSRWRKAVNALSLRILIALSKKEGDTELDIKGRFNAIISNPAKYPLMVDNHDNLQMTYNGTDKSNNFPLFPTGGTFYVTRAPLCATWLDLLTAVKDARVFKIAQPASGLADDPLNPFARYKGAKTGDIQSVVQDQTNQGKYASLNQAYWLKDANGIPCIQLSVSEQLFNIAEGINRGWATGDAAASYKKAIELSTEFYGTAQDPTFWIQPAVAYKGNNAAGLQQILTQKYVAFFNNSGYEAYFNYRRTGVPVFNIGPSNENGGLIPVRFSYPQSEYTNNSQNVQAAVQSQFGGADTRNDVMWLLK